MLKHRATFSRKGRRFLTIFLYMCISSASAPLKEAVIRGSLASKIERGAAAVCPKGL
jgi:hypothetical protein